mmetsp:Transcript_20906/g.57974  ORF Transcript_20906/g.57974 Transcript_20906/m.57974 type:complete len:223 (+) Transcript_20906:639-1307(+)
MQKSCLRQTLPSLGKLRATTTVRRRDGGALRPPPLQAPRGRLPPPGHRHLLEGLPGAPAAAAALGHLARTPPPQGGAQSLQAVLPLTVPVRATARGTGTAGERLAPPQSTHPRRKAALAEGAVTAPRHGSVPGIQKSRTAAPPRLAVPDHGGGKQCAPPRLQHWEGQLIGGGRKTAQSTCLQGSFGSGGGGGLCALTVSGVHINFCRQQCLRIQRRNLALET